MRPIIGRTGSVQRRTDRKRQSTADTQSLSPIGEIGGTTSFQDIIADEHLNPLH
jgi:hypothetical protein